LQRSFTLWPLAQTNVNETDDEQNSGRNGVARGHQTKWVCSAVVGGVNKNWGDAVQGGTGERKGNTGYATIL